MEEHLDLLTKVCRDAGVKVTPQRLEIFREISTTDDHPDAETILERVRVRLPMVSLDTVYRTLWLLNDLRLLTTIGPPRKSVRFDANLEHHHHFVCRLCGLTKDFSCPTLDGLELPAAACGFGSIETTHVEVRGVCLACARAEGRTPITVTQRED